MILALVLIATAPAVPRAHDIPDKVVVQAFIKPEGERLHVLVRLPLILLLDNDLPKRGPGYLELAYLDPALEVAAEQTSGDIEVFEEDAPLTPSRSEALISLPSDKSFATFEEALAHIQGPRLPNETDVYWNQGFFDVHFEYPIRSASARFSARLGLARGLGDRLHASIRFITPDGAVRPFEFLGDTDRVVFDPRWHQAAWVFVKAGFSHILDGLDHLLFLLCLVIPVRRVRSLVIVVTAFTVAHSITLIAAAFNLAPSGAWFPPLIETLIAVSIVYMALENIVAPSESLRWLVSFVFGLVHGFGFSFALRETMQFAGSHLLLSLLSFNVGVEFGQLAVILVFVPALALLFRHVVAERIGTIILSALVAHVGWHWMTERWQILSRVGWPTIDLLVIAAVARWTFAALLLGGLGWVLAGRVWRRQAARAPRAERDPI